LESKSYLRAEGREIGGNTIQSLFFLHRIRNVGTTTLPFPNLKVLKYDDLLLSTNILNVPVASTWLYIEIESSII